MHFLLILAFNLSIKVSKYNFLRTHGAKQGYLNVIRACCMTPEKNPGPPDHSSATLPSKIACFCVERGQMRCGYAHSSEQQFSGSKFMLTKEDILFDISFHFLLEAVPSFVAFVLLQ